MPSRCISSTSCFALLHLALPQHALNADAENVVALVLQCDGHVDVGTPPEPERQGTHLRRFTVGERQYAIARRARLVRGRRFGAASQQIDSSACDREVYPHSARTNKRLCQHGKFTQVYQQEITTLQVAPGDMKRRGLAQRGPCASHDGEWEARGHPAVDSSRARRVSAPGRVSLPARNAGVARNL